MRLVLIHAWLITLTLLRYPGYVVPTIGFPAMFFLFFASPARGPVAAYALCSFAAFAVIGVAFFQFGVGIATERASPWELYLRTLPVLSVTRLAARLLSAAAFAVVAALGVVGVAVVSTDASLPAARWVQLCAVLLLAIVPFGCLGIALGYWASPRAALPLANVIYLGLSFGGGLWIRPARLPHPVSVVSAYLPTRHLANALAGVVRGSPWQAGDWLALAGFSVAFAVAALLGYQRDEGERFR